MQVVADPSSRVRHSFEEGGMCRISLTFLEAGDNKYPVAQEIPSLRVSSFADRVQAIATARFSDVFSVAGMPEWVRDDALSDISRIVGAAQTVYRRVSSAQWTDLLGDAAGLASSLFGLFQGGTGMAGLQIAKQFSQQPRVVSSGLVGSTAQQQSSDNSKALLNLVTAGSIAQAARDIVAVEAPVYDDLQQWRRELIAVVDREVERPDLPQASFEALADVRSEVSRYVLSESATASRLRTYVPRATLPAVVLAYDLYEDAGRSDELVQRNGLRHPGFVPPEPLKVLSA